MCILVRTASLIVPLKNSLKNKLYQVHITSYIRVYLLFLDSYLGLRFDGKSYFAIDATNYTEIRTDIMNLFSIQMKFKAESANGILLIIDGSLNEYAIEYCIKEFRTVTIPV